jgi:hypothetical protein
MPTIFSPLVDLLLAQHVSASALPNMRLPGAGRQYKVDHTGFRQKGAGRKQDDI